MYKKYTFNITMLGYKKCRKPCRLSEINDAAIAINQKIKTKIITLINAFIQSRRVNMTFNCFGSY